MEPNGNGLTPKQRRMIAELLAQPTQRAALAAAGVGASTLHRWRTEPAFVDALSAARRELFADGYNQLLGYQTKTLDELARLALEADNDGVRVRALVALEAAICKRHELLTLGDLERRVAQLEQSQP